MISVAHPDRRWRELTWQASASTTITTTGTTTEMVSIASRHIMRVCLLTTRLREALLPTDLSVPLTHPPIHLPVCLQVTIFPVPATLWRLALRIPGGAIARLPIIPSVDTSVAEVPILAHSTLTNQLYWTLKLILRARATTCAHTLALPASGHGKEVTTCAPG